MCNGQAPHTQHPVMESRGGGEDIRAPGHSTRSLHVVSIHRTLEETTMVDLFFSPDCLSFLVFSIGSLPQLPNFCQEFIPEPN